ncbi:substrate-binding domain-containing protein [Undibacterium sp.]|jgi:molybdate transport repressor ModE-like protein|uniref:substrate-binding domain-containing protein n=1 Tax=Undibacterium sp. TaxID=1914977 RepID=UPI002B67F61C|nr:substrate-binding domain-containing protein [Undibacterium sp.]HTD05932.1 substrate-binding domain-containing protein [Undibacterium sp.]
MYKITINPHWQIATESNQATDTTMLIRLLVLIQQTGSIALAAKAAGLSYRYAWGLLHDAEALFNGPLVISGRGRGTALTALAEKLMWADRRIAARLSPLLESLASELANELDRIQADNQPALRIDASHGFAVAALLEQIQAAALPVELRYRNSSEALAALSRKECDLAGFHVPIGAHEQQAVTQYLRWLDPERHALIHLAVRTQGLFVASGNPLDVKSLSDIVRGRLRFVNRPQGSGTRMLLEFMLAELGIAPAEINGFESAEFTHAAVAAYIASGMADAGLGVETAARHFGLDFIPLVQERYFFAIARDAIQLPLMQQIIGILQSASFKCTLGRLAGYDGADAGDILNLGHAFSSSR